MQPLMTVLVIIATKELQTNTMGILHLIFRPSLTELQSPNPQRSPASSAVWLNQFRQI
jgi:hypothetical protein